MASPKEIAPLLPDTLPEDFGDWDNESSLSPSPVHSDEREAWESAHSFGDAPNSLWDSAERDAFLDSLGDKPRASGSASSAPVPAKKQNGSVDHDGESFDMPTPVSPREWEAWEAARPFVKPAKPLGQPARREAILPPPVDKPRDLGSTSSAPAVAKKQESTIEPANGSPMRASQKLEASRATNALPAAPSRPKATSVHEMRNSPEVAARLKRDADEALSQLFSPKNRENLRKRTTEKKRRMIVVPVSVGAVLLLLIFLVLIFHHGAKPAVKQPVQPPAVTNAPAVTPAPTAPARKSSTQEKPTASDNQPASEAEGANSSQAPTAKQTKMMNDQLTAPSKIPKQVAEDVDPTAGFAAPGGDGLAGSGVNKGFFNGRIKPVVKAAPTKPIAISSGVATGMLIQKTEPIYPPIAKAARVYGTVELHAIISKDGTIKDLHAVSGPAMLQGAAVDAVRTWRYKPYKLNNEPTEVETTVNVIFTLSQ